MPLQQTIEKTQGQPATVASLAKDLSDLGLVQGSVVIVHASLGSLGWVCGGAVAVVEALKGVIGPSGTIVVPTHTSGLSDPAHWVNPPVPKSWWPTIRESMPAFDARVTPSQGMGVLAECIRTYPGTIRSDHPQLSFAALGPRAKRITDKHELSPGLGELSPIGRLYELNAAVLLLGVGHDRNTSLHLSEVRAFGDDMKMVQTGSPMKRDGCRVWHEFIQPDYDETDFLQLGKAFTESTDTATGFVAKAKSQLVSHRELVDFGVSWLRSNRTT